MGRQAGPSIAADDVLQGPCALKWAWRRDSIRESGASSGWPCRRPRRGRDSAGSGRTHAECRAGGQVSGHPCGCGRPRHSLPACPRCPRTARRLRDGARVSGHSAVTRPPGSFAGSAGSSSLPRPPAPVSFGVSVTRPSVPGPVRDAAGRVAVLAPRAPHRTRFRFPELRAEAVSGRSGHPQGQRAWEGGAGLGGGDRAAPPHRAAPDGGRYGGVARRGDTRSHTVIPAAENLVTDRQRQWKRKNEAIRRERRLETPRSRKKFFLVFFSFFFFG